MKEWQRLGSLFHAYLTGRTADEIRCNQVLKTLGACRCGVLEVYRSDASRFACHAGGSKFSGGNVTATACEERCLLRLPPISSHVIYCFEVQDDFEYRNFSELFVIVGFGTGRAAICSCPWRRRRFSEQICADCAHVSIHPQLGAPPAGWAGSERVPRLEVPAVMWAVAK